MSKVISVAPRSALRVCSTKDDVGRELAKLLGEIQSQPRGTPNASVSVAISGGSLPNVLAKGLEETDMVSLCDTWKIFLADERLVPLDHVDSNYKLAKDELRLSDSHFFPIRPELIPDPVRCAEEYALRLKDEGVDKFDVVLLGLGPDGHTASLFPGHPLLREESKRVASIVNSPKPPPERITLTFPMINEAENVIFVVTGESKADVVQRIFEVEDSGLPGQMVRPDSGNLFWVIDQAAASKLSK